MNYNGVMVRGIGLWALAQASASAAEADVAQGAGTAAAEAVSLFAVILVLAAMLFGLAYLLRKKFSADDGMLGAGSAFNLESLRELHRQGLLTDEEYERAKKIVVEAVRRSLERAKQPPEGPGAGRRELGREGE